MGISAEMHRARIGTYQCRNIPTRKKLQDGSSKFMSLPVSLLITLILLFMAGIELNPGPVYYCGTCPEVSSSAEKYFVHQKEKHALIKCCFPHCPNSFVALSSFQSHLTRVHGPKRSECQLPIRDVCPVLNCGIPRTGRTFKQHLEDHLDTGHSFDCPYGNSCKTHHSKKASFRTHVSQKHPPRTEDPSTSGSGTDVAISLPVISNPPPINPFPPNVIKNNVVLFYLELEGLKVLPSITIQFISQKIASFSEGSHHNMKLTLEKELISAGIEKRKAGLILNATFKADPVYNIHHIGCDREQVTSIYLRQQEMKKRAPYIPAIEVQLHASTIQGKTRVAHYVPLMETLNILLKDSNVKTEILKSFSRQSNHEVFEDFCDGSAFKAHLEQHNHHKCIQIIMFQDAFEYCPFGPAKGLYKTDGWYFMIGNLHPEFRSKLDMIMLNFLIQEQFLKPSLKELLDMVNKHEEALATMIAEFQKLKNPQIIIDDIAYPVCLIFMTGDNLGQHQLGGYVQSFSGNYWCRFCPISKEEFLNAPHTCKPLRSIEDYENCGIVAKQNFLKLKAKSIKNQARRKEKALRDRAAGQDVEVPNKIISENAMKELQAVHHFGIKPLPSPMNKIPGYHVNLGMPPCLAHDLFEGVVNVVLAKILENLVSKNWFDLNTLNRRIVGFKCKGQDTADAPNKIKSFDGIKGHACETWTLLRLLPLMLDNLIKDPEDPYWLLYLELKQIVEYIVAPKISMSQINRLSVLIQEYLCNCKELLPSCLTAKSHYLAHYCKLITIFGPLIRLAGLRFESRHVFFKKVAQQCKNFINITKTLAQKYQCKFACDHLNGFLPEDLEYKVQEELVLPPPRLPPIPSHSKLKRVKEVTFRGTKYELNMYMVLNKEGILDLSVGCISDIFIYPDETVYFILKTHTASISGNGYYIINKDSTSTKETKLSDLPDYYPLPSYTINNGRHGKIECLSLKHTAVFM